MKLATLLLVSGLLNACGEYDVGDSRTVPERPTWDNSVRVIMEEHCVRCHGAKPDRGAPPGFRLDLYSASGRVAGAASVGEQSLASVQRGSMPPGLGSQFGRNNTEILRRWVAGGVPKN